MTEYEIADLAVSTQAIFWQQNQLLQGQAARGFELMQQFGTILFGYLIVAYFVGAQLTRVQSVIFTALYLFWQVRVCWVMFTVSINVNSLLGEMRKISPDFDPAVPSLLWVYTLLFCLTLASIYFMWSVRHPKTE